MAALALRVILLAFACLFTLFHHGSAIPLPEIEFAEQSLPYSSEIQGGQGSHWVTTFTAAPESVKMGTGGVAFRDTTIRQTVPLSIGSNQIRLTLSNAYGTSDLSIEKVTVALPQSEGGNYLGSCSINTDSLKTLTFGGQGSANVPAGNGTVSDPVTFDPPLPAGQVIAVSMYLRSGQASETTTSHFYSQTTSGTAQGDQTSSATIPTTGRNGMSWYFISSVEAWGDSTHKALVVVGDSITDGRGSPINANLKWPSILGDRTQATQGLEHISVVNQGVGGNQVVTDSEGPTLFQPSAVKRLQSDVLDRSGVGYVMLFEGINDIGSAAADEASQKSIETRLIQGYQEIISKVHAQGLPIIGATITPFMCPPNHAGRSNRYALDPIRDQTRLNVNQWIKNSGAFDQVVDFDQVLKDPQNPATMAPAYIGPDCLHPSAAGYKALAQGFPLDVLTKIGGGYSKIEPRQVERRHLRHLERHRNG